VVTWKDFLVVPIKTAEISAREGLLDGERPFHAGLSVPGDTAEEGVVAGFELDRGRAFALGDNVGATDLFAVFFDFDVVFDRRGVIEVDLYFAGFGFEALLFVGERAFVGDDFERAARARRFASGFLVAFAARGRFAVFVLFEDVVLFGFLLGLAVLLGLDFLIRLLELVLAVLGVFLRVKNREGTGPDRAGRENENHDDTQLAGEFFGFQPDEADEDR
jgi:hypothetical protein